MATYSSSRDPDGNYTPLEARVEWVAIFAVPRIEFSFIKRS
jgi:hypothetical protein